MTLVEDDDWWYWWKLKINCSDDEKHLGRGRVEDIDGLPESSTAESGE